MVAKCRPAVHMYCGCLLAWVALPVTCVCQGASAIVSVSLPINDMVYDPVSNRILASVPSSAGPLRGNTITPIDPQTGALGDSVFVNSEPTILALADDGSRVYVASDTTNYVTPFSLTTMTAENPFAIGDVNRRVSDMSVPPGHPDKLAVSRRVLNQSPNGAGVAIYVDGVRMPKESSDLATNDILQFGTSPNILYGHVNSLSSYDFNTNTIDLSPGEGYLGNNEVKHMLTKGGMNMKYDNGRMYFTNGQVVNPTVPAPLGQFSADGAFEPVAELGRTFFVVGDELRAYSQATFVKVGEMTIPGLVGTARDVISLGNAGLAVRTTADRLYIIHGIPGDYDIDGTVSHEDYLLWKSGYGSEELPDLDGNGDGAVNAADYTIWRNNLGTTLGGPLVVAPSASIVPEPSTLSLALLVAIGIACRPRYRQLIIAI